MDAFGRIVFDKVSNKTVYFNLKTQFLQILSFFWQLIYIFVAIISELWQTR